MDKAELARKLVEGDPEALTAWFEGNADSLYAFVYYRVANNADLAADVTQATFTLALERFSDYDPARGDMTTWLRTLSRNVIRKYLMNHRRAIRLDTLWNRIDRSLQKIYEEIDRTPFPETALEEKETRELVGKTMANLPSQYREVLEAKYMEAQPLEEIARRRATTLDGVKAMLRRARAAFRETFLTLAKTEVT